LCIVFAFSKDEFGKHPYLIFRKMYLITRIHAGSLNVSYFVGLE
jgi:hypothetical protein